MQRLILVLNTRIARLLSATGLKIDKEIQHIDLEKAIHNHKDQDKHQGFHSNAGQSHFLDTHSDIKMAEKSEAVKYAVKNLKQFILNHPEYKELIVIAESRILGIFRQQIDKEIQKMIFKEIDKDLVHSSIDALEKLSFSS